MTIIQSIAAEWILCRSAATGASTSSDYSPSFMGFGLSPDGDKGLEQAIQAEYRRFEEPVSAKNSRVHLHAVTNRCRFSRPALRCSLTDPSSERDDEK